MPITVPNLDDRTFDDLYREVRARVAVHTPEWTNLNDSDPGVTLLQLFSFLVDNLSYRSNRIPEATRLTFLTLLGMGLQPATPATGFTAFSVEGHTVTVPAGAVTRAGKVEFRTRRTVNIVPLEAHVFWKRPRTDLDSDTLDHLKRLHEPFLGESGTAQLVFYDPVELDQPTTGATPTIVDLADPVSGPVDGALWIALTASPAAVRAAGNAPEAAVAALRPLVAGQTVTLGVLPGATTDGRTLDPQRTVAAAVDPGLFVEAASSGSAPTYQRLTLTYADEVLDRPGVLDVQLPALERLTGPWDTDPSTEGTGDYPPVVQDRSLAARIVTWLRVRRRSSGIAGAGLGGAAIAWIGVNVVSVVQSTRVDRERLGVGTGAPDQRYRLANAPVLLTDPEARPLLEVQGPTLAWEAWQQTDSLYAAGPDEKVFSIDAEAGVVSFGSGLHGFRPALQRAIRITYEYGGGPQGVVPIDAINRADGLAADVKVRNPIATWGGAAGETVADGERAIPAWLRHRDRAVTGADFRDIVLHTPGVDLGRVDVLPLFDPRPNTPSANATDAPGAVTVMVVPRADALRPSPPATTDPHVLEAVCAWLDPKRLITTQVFVRGARWVPIVVSVGIALMPGEVREEIEQRARDTLREYLSPLTGGLGTADADGIAVESTGVSPTGWPLGVGVRIDDLAAAVTRVPGVRYVEGVRLAVTRDGTTSSDVGEVALTGLELPHATVFVSVGQPEDPLALMGDRLLAPDVVPVPVVPRKC
jgi:Baseplate J-like protein